MKIITLLILIVFLFIITSCAERELPTGTTEPGIEGLFKEIRGNVSGILSISGSPYKIMGDIVVGTDSTLQIEPGVKLYFTSNTRLIVNGKLIVKGNYYYPVLFAAYDINKPWRGIKFYNSKSANIIDFADIREIDEPGDSLYQTASIALISSSVEINHSWIYNNSAVHGGAIGLFNSNADIRNNIFENNKASQFGGAIMAYQSDLTLINNTLYQNTSVNSGGGVVILEPVSAELQNNIFYKNKSGSGNPNFAYALKDSSLIIEKYNYFAVGSMDPLFYSTDDFRLTYYSPCKDAGNPDPIFNDVNGTRNDQGAYGGPLGNW